tara:strand:+ start:1715 stop:2389 length:675 start_codon:yes stop_codon:yes gene_type:complete
MSQHDFDINNATAAAARVDINLALKALGSLSSGTTPPATTYANMLWYETDTNWIFVRNEANSAWVRFVYVDQSTNLISLVDNTRVVNTSGTQVGMLGDQATGTWQAGTGTLDSLVSPANVKAAILALQSTYTQPTTINSVGSYAFLVRVGVAVYGNSTYAGSGLLRAGVHGVSTSTTINQSLAGNISQLTRGDAYSSGTWRAMGSDTYQPTTTANRLTLFLRIS